MLKISHLPRIMIRMKRKGKAAVGGRVYRRSVCRYHEARYPARPDIRDDASIVPYKLFAAFIIIGKVSLRRDEGIPPYSMVVSK